MYINKVLKKFLHRPPQQTQYAPHQWTQPTSWQKIQYATTSTRIGKNRENCNKLLAPLYLMDYESTFLSAKVRYYAGDMQLHVESNVAILVLPGTRSQIPGAFLSQCRSFSHKSIC